MPRHRDGRRRRAEALNNGDGAVHKTLMSLAKFKKDENGAALIEYTVLLGILVVAVITTIVAVGTWVNGRWTALNSALPAN
jgi:pilus assembly protein Flp/PilA